MKNISFSPDEFEYIKDVVESDDIKLDSLKPSSKKSAVIKEKVHVVDSIMEKLDNVERSSVNFI